MGIEDYQVNGMVSFEKPESEKRLDYLNAYNFGHLRFPGSSQCAACRCRACVLAEGATDHSGWFNVTRIINPSVCRYSEV